MLADAPLLYWRLGEAAGVTAVADASGNGRTGTSNSGVTQAVPGALVIDDGAASFDGSDSEITSSYNPFSGSKTFEFWAKTDNYAAAGNKAFFGSDSTNPQFIINAAGTIFFVYNGLSQTVWSGAWATIGDNLWAHVVVAWDPAGTAKLYLNGVDQGANTGTIAAYGATGNLTVGARGASTGAFLAGDIDEFAVYTGALPAARVAAHYEAARWGGVFFDAAKALNPAMYLRFDDSDATLLDSSNRGNNATANAPYTLQSTSLAPDNSDSISLEGASDASTGGWVTADSYAPFAPGAIRTVSFLVKINSDQSHMVNLFCDLNTVTGNNSMVLEVTPTLNHVRFYGDVATYFPTGLDWVYQFSVGTTYHIVFRVDDNASTFANQLSLTINGTDLGPPSITAAGGTPSVVQHFSTDGVSRPFQFGRRDGATNTEYIDANYDEMLIYERWLPAAEVAALFAATGLTAGPTPWSQSVPDTVTPADALIKAAGSAQADSAALADAFVKSPRSVQGDSATLADTFVKAPHVFRTEAVTPADVLATVSAYHLGLADSASLAESFAKAARRVQADSATLADAFVKAARITRTESVTPADALQTVEGFHLGLADSAALAEGFVKKPQHTLADTVSLADVRTAVARKLFAEAVTPADALQTAEGFHAGLTDSLSLTDAFAKHPSHVLTDTVTLADAQVRAVTRLIADAVALADQINAGGTSSLTKSLADTVTLADGRTLSIGKTFAEALGVSDVIAKRAVLALAESLGLTDARGEAVWHALSETVFLTDEVHTSGGIIFPGARPPTGGTPRTILVSGLPRTRGAGGAPRAPTTGGVPRATLGGGEPD